MKTDKRHIEQMIEAYFDCTLSEEQEQALKGLLARTTLTSPAIEEAKAVMGVFAAGRNSQSARSSQSVRSSKSSQSSQNSRRNLLRYAAAASVALAIGISSLLYINASQNICVMYANGEKISNSELVLAQMNSELSVVGAIDSHIDQTIQSELQDISEALGSIESMD